MQVNIRVLRLLLPFRDWASLLAVFSRIQKHKFFMQFCWFITQRCINCVNVLVFNDKRVHIHKSSSFNVKKIFNHSKTILYFNKVVQCSNMTIFTFKNVKNRASDSMRIRRNFLTMVLIASTQIWESVSLTESCSKCWKVLFPLSYLKLNPGKHGIIEKKPFCLKCFKN